MLPSSGTCHPRLQPSLRLGNHPHPSKLWRDRIGRYPCAAKRPAQGIDGLLGGGIPHLEMQMRAEAPARIAAPTDGISSCKPKGGVGLSIKCPALCGILSAHQPRRDVRVEGGKVRVHSGPPLTVEVEGQSIPPTGHLDPGNGPVLRCENGVALLPFGPDIEAGMEMSRPDFTKIPAEFEWNRQWSMKRVLRSGTVDCAPTQGQDDQCTPSNRIHSRSHVRKIPRACHPMEAPHYI